MSTPIVIDVSVLLGTAGERKHYDALVTMERVTRGDEVIDFAGAAEVDVVIDSVKRGMLSVEGDVSAVLKLSCSRCLREFTEAYGAPLKELFCVPIRAEQADECYVIEGHEIDLGPAVEQAFRLALPMKLLCGEECHGLCSVCGADLNQNPEHSHESAPDTRFSELGRLLGGGDWEERSDDSD